MTFGYGDLSGRYRGGGAVKTSETIESVKGGRALLGAYQNSPKGLAGPTGTFTFTKDASCEGYICGSVHLSGCPTWHTDFWLSPTQSPELRAALAPPSVPGWCRTARTQKPSSRD